MKQTKYKLTVTFTEPVLGSQATKGVAQEFIHAKARENGIDVPPEELETLPEALERGTTVFNKRDGVPGYFNYVIKGFLKEAASVFNGENGVKNMRSKADNLIFVSPRWIPLVAPDGSQITFNERPLRAQTAQGPRVALARSEELPAGTRFECELTVLGKVFNEKLLNSLIGYGQFKGIGQWRNGGYGTIEATLEKTATIGGGDEEEE